MNKKQKKIWFYIIMFASLVPMILANIQTPALTAEQKLGAYLMTIVMLIVGLSVLNWKVWEHE